MIEIDPAERATAPDLPDAGWRDRASWLLMHWLGPAIPIAIIAVKGYQQRWVSEDAFISLRVVEQILAGNGPIFNDGERVEAYTHPLWVAILAIWGGLGLPTPIGTVILGIAFTVVGLIAAMAAASRLLDRIAWPPPCRPEPQRRTSPRLIRAAIGRERSFAAAQDDRGAAILLPVGALIFAVIPVVWDFVTSGLESGLSFAWLGVSYWLLVRVCFADGEDARRSWIVIAAAVVIGLGPLVRPDLAVFSAAFLLCLIAYSREASRLGVLRRTLMLGAAAASFPLVYQLFRMGYFAALVPNTALAKEASEPRWEQGWIYLRDFTDTYHLWLPLLIAAGFLGQATWRAWQNNDHPALSVMIAPVGAAIVHTIYVVRVGGDFMHGRFLLPTLFGLLLPVMLVRIPLVSRQVAQTAATTAALLLLAGWSVAAVFWLRVPYENAVSEDGLADERGIYVLLAGHHNPIEIEDYTQMSLGWTQEGQAWHDLAREHPRVLIVEEAQYPLSPSFEPGIDLVAFTWNIGLSGYAAGIDVHVTDRYGLADPLASRLLLTERGRPGHEKQLDPVWAIARFSTSAADTGLPPAVATARAALACGELPDLLDAVGQPLTTSRFFDNLLLSWSLHDLRIPNDPQAAVDEHC
ncbi:MAG TPA: hypothetical protein VEX37_02055 [Thermomicrobiales bacterium]|nr:hypothetical protein [Thermomicrobiales bacterium]